MVDHSGSTTEPQDAFGELARIILADHSLESVMDRVAQLTKDTVPGAHEVSVRRGGVTGPPMPAPRGRTAV